MTALNASVLIADDEPTIATIIERTVNQMGFATVVVSDGAQAVQAARTLDTRLICIIFDVAMPVMSGIDAAAAIRAFAPDVSIILMSGSDHIALSQHAMPKSHFAFMEKPFTLAHLRDLLKQVLPDKEREA